ncbi:unnamed protein product [Didymodactylos carnosus]|uniref:C2 domain-containing protein n=1 Tax=Didymodactylos carnosus TaxID=1234261 RepID=A0A814DXK7_9BILA|nr:unnamed protein product [Didymodactylos carnosus]CAF3735526.1 unnamed protein product [Didymodactylos carnosus]
MEKCPLWNVTLKVTVTYKCVSLWSDTVPIFLSRVSFLNQDTKPQKLQFRLASIIEPDDKLTIEFYITSKKKRKKLWAMFEIILENIIDTKILELEENLTDPNNFLIKSTFTFKLHYAHPDLATAVSTLGGGEIQGQDEIELLDIFNEDENTGYKHRVKKGDLGKLGNLKRKLGKKHGDEDGTHDLDGTDDVPPEVVDEADQMKKTMNNMELLQKSLGRYDGDPYQLTEWQVMVHVIQGRELPGLDINPYVVVQIDDEKHTTMVQKLTNAPFYGEFFTFDFNLPASQMFEKVIYFRVHNSKKIISKFTDGTPLGIFKVDIATIYNEKEHAFERKWAQLTDPNAVGITCGHLLMSIMVAQRGVPSKVCVLMYKIFQCKLYRKG